LPVPAWPAHGGRLRDRRTLKSTGRLSYGWVFFFGPRLLPSPRVMTSNKARHASGPVLLPSKCGCSARAYHRGSTPSPSPVCQNRGDRHGPQGPHHDPRPPFAKIEGIIPIPIRDRFAGDGGSSPWIPGAVPIGDSAPCLRHKEQASFSLLILGLTQRRAKSKLLNLQTRSTHWQTVTFKIKGTSSIR
jgi:hypothetical protein